MCCAEQWGPYMVHACHKPIASCPALPGSSLTFSKSATCQIAHRPSVGSKTAMLHLKVLHANKNAHLVLGGNRQPWGLHPWAGKHGRWAHDWTEGPPETAPWRTRSPDRKQMGWKPPRSCWQPPNSPRVRWSSYLEPLRNHSDLQTDWNL